MDTAAWYRRFAEVEARGSSPQYECLAQAVAGSDDILRWLSHIPASKRQPNLLFAAVRFLGGETASATNFVDFVRSRSAELADTMLCRSTQTNEVGRCAAFVPLLADLEADIALIEVGASAGLCLYPDRYSYDYGGTLLGDSTLTISVETSGSVPVPDRLPKVTWRAGLDLNPLDVCCSEDLAWLRACIWPEHGERRRRLDLAAEIAANDPPRIDRGDLRAATLALIDEAPSEAIKVVFHSAVLAYVDEVGRREFTATMRRVVQDRDDVVWFSNEAPFVVDGVPDAPTTAARATEPARFHLARNGSELIALTDPHGAWIEWVSACTDRPIDCGCPSGALDVDFSEVDIESQCHIDVGAVNGRIA